MQAGVGVSGTRSSAPPPRARFPASVVGVRRARVVAPSANSPVPRGCRGPAGIALPQSGAGPGAPSAQAQPQPQPQPRARAAAGHPARHRPCSPAPHTSRPPGGLPSASCGSGGRTAARPGSGIPDPPFTGEGRGGEAGARARGEGAEESRRGGEGPPPFRGWGVREARGRAGRADGREQPPGSSGSSSSSWWSPRSSS